MGGYLLASIIGGILLGAMDGIINANPLAQSLFRVYAPIARKSVNFIDGIAIDLVYGFVMAGIFLLLYTSLPSEVGVLKGICFGFMAWFFRVVMHAASQWMMFSVPLKTTLYTVVTGLAEMLVLGVLFGLVVKPFT